jgi:hypothetical protein
MIPQDMQPPPLAATKHGKLSFHVCFNFSRRRPEFKIVQSFRRVPQPAFITRLLLRPQCASRLAGAYLSCSKRARQTSRLRNFDTVPPSSYCYEFRSDNRLESVANVHTAADLHARPVP